MDTRVTAIAGKLSEAQLRSREETARRLGSVPPPNYFINRALSLIDETTASRMLRRELFDAKSLKSEKLNAARLVALDAITDSLIGAESEPDALLTLITRMADGFTDIFPYAGVAVEFRRDILSTHYPPPDLQSFPNLSQSSPRLISQITREPSTIEDVNQRMMGLPLLDKKHNLLGVITLSLSQNHSGFPQEIMSYAEKLQIKSARMLENIAYKERLEQEAITDSLTGLNNRRHFDKALYDEISRSERYNHPLSLLTFDIDLFKQINDGYGHTTGDRVLIELAELVKQSIRKEIDIAARPGGDEFALILPETDLISAQELAKRLIKKVEEHSFKTDKGEPIKVTISIGVATLNPDVHTPEDLISAADKNLYLAKGAGRNRVV